MIQDITFRAPAIGAPSNVIPLSRRMERVDVLLDGTARRLAGLADWHFGQAERLRRVDQRRGLTSESRAAMDRSRREATAFEDRAREIERLAHADRRTFHAALDGVS